jgi:hypothetical protein
MHNSITAVRPALPGQQYLPRLLVVDQTVIQSDSSFTEIAAFVAEQPPIVPQPHPDQPTFISHRLDIEAAIGIAL